MEKQRILILDRERINRKLQRMAYQIWEYNSDETAVILIGINGTGAIVARELANRLKQISPLNVTVFSLALNKRHPMKEETFFEENIAGKSVILVDDVANSGKTLLYALKPLLKYEMKKIQVAVLVDRRHKSFPITPDIVGQSVSTTLQEHIEVETEGNEVTAAYLE